MKHRLLAAAISLMTLLLLPTSTRAEAAQPVVINDAAGMLAMAQQTLTYYALGLDEDD